MLYLYIAAIILHVATAASWFGLSIRLPELSKRIASSDQASANTLAASGMATVEMMNKFPVLLYVFALIAISLGPGFGGIGWPFHIALTLGLVLILIQIFLIRRNWAALQEAVGTENVDVARKKVAMSLGVGHLVWFVLLVLMFLPRVIAV